MDIWITWCRRRATCRFCSEPIEAGKPMVKGKLWRKHGEATKWSFYSYWHPECWLKEAYTYLETHPYQPAERTRLRLSEEDKMLRLKILRERARLVSRLRDIMLYGNDDPVEHILTRLQQLRTEIEPLGGVPKSWDKPLFKELP